jgi:hypothetical protein
VRLRCYLPSTSAIVIILIVGFLLLRHATSHTFAAAGLATMIVMAVGATGLVAGTIVVSAVLIRRRRAAAGACHTCSHPCREAMVPLPELDAPLWPHRPLSSTKLPVTVLPVTAIPHQTAAPQTEQLTGNRERVRALSPAYGHYAHWPLSGSAFRCLSA